MLRFVKACFQASRGVDKRKGKQTGKRARRHAGSVVHQLYGLSASNRTGGPVPLCPWHCSPPERRLVSVVPQVAGERETSPHADGPGAFQGSSALPSVAPPAHAPARIYAHKEGAGAEKSSAPALEQIILH